MSKELEALKRLGALEISISNNGRFVIHVHDILEYSTLLQALTPPTAEEVCAALSEYLILYKFNSKCIFKDNNFYEKCDDGVLEIIIECDNGLIDFYFTLPPHLITLIGRFYEGVIRNE